MNRWWCGFAQISLLYQFISPYWPLLALMSQAFSNPYCTLHTQVILFPWSNPEGYGYITSKKQSLALSSTQKFRDKNLACLQISQRRAKFDTNLMKKPYLVILLTETTFNYHLVTEATWLYSVSCFLWIRNN